MNPYGSWLLHSNVKGAELSRHLPFSSSYHVIQELAIDKYHFFSPPCPTVFLHRDICPLGLLYKPLSESNPMRVPQLYLPSQTGIISLHEITLLIPLSFHHVKTKSYSLVAGISTLLSTRTGHTKWFQFPTIRKRSACA